MRALRIRPALPHDREPLARFLRDLSAESAYGRFLVGTVGTPGRAVLDGLLPAERRGGALLVFVEDELVGHGLWVTLDGGAAAEIAIVVADRHQRKGVGTMLADGLMAELSARGIERVQALSSAGNLAVRRMIARQAADVLLERDGTTVTYSFPTPATVVRALPLAAGSEPTQLQRSA